LAETGRAPLWRYTTKIILLFALAIACLTAIARFVIGLTQRPQAFDGYTLVAPLLSTATYLIDMDGRPVRTWQSEYLAGQTACLLENGHLLRAGQLTADERLFSCPQAGGHVQEFTWDGELVWDFTFHNKTQISHHDIAPLPSGNVLLTAWEVKTAGETRNAGRDPNTVEGPWLVDSVIEIKPTGKTTGEVVWEWHVWDHLIQDRDSSKPNYGDVAAHPELIDINFGETLMSEVSHRGKSREEEARRKQRLKALNSIGYLGAPTARGGPATMPDWTHVNALSYHPGLDQIMLTVRAFSECWIIDHSTTSAQAHGHTGGRAGKGGDLLYRWGNPQAYRAGTKRDQRLFAPHDGQFIPPGAPGAGDLLVFNNGVGRPGGDYSSVDEILLPLGPDGQYSRTAGSAYGPRAPVWSYTAPEPIEFSAGLLSSAQRLPNGNTLISDGVNGRIFEVAPDRNVVWQQTTSNLATSAPRPPIEREDRQEPAAQSHRVLTSAVNDALNLSTAQKAELESLETEVDAAIEAILTGDQRERLRKRSHTGSDAMGGIAEPGQIMSRSRQVILGLSALQKKQLADLQNRCDQKLEHILTVSQKGQLAKIKQDFARGGRPETGTGSPRATARSDRESRKSSPAPVPLPSGVYPVFRAIRYAKTYSGLSGKTSGQPKSQPRSGEMP
jgi:hypothetical protein